MSNVLGHMPALSIMCPKSKPEGESFTKNESLGWEVLFGKGLVPRTLAETFELSIKYLGSPLNVGDSIYFISQST